MSSDENEEIDYTVEAIRGWRYNNHENCRKEFLIKWEGFPEEDNTYEPQENLSCEDILAKFVASLDPEQRKYFDAKNPKKLNGFQRNSIFSQCIGADIPQDANHQSSLVPSTSSPSGFTRDKFVLLVLFDDSLQLEEVTLDEFFKYQPAEALKFFEQRFVYMK